MSGSLWSIREGHGGDSLDFATKTRGRALNVPCPLRETFVIVARGSCLGVEYTRSLHDP